MTTSSMVNIRFVVILAALFGLAIGLTMSISTALAGHLDTNGNPLPHGTYKIWSFNSTPVDFSVGTTDFGFDPNMSAADEAGVTGHVATDADPLTIVIVFENTFCSGLPCGVTYLNPVTDFAKCYGYSGGIMTGVDINETAPTLTGPGGQTYQTGDVWLAKSGGFSTTSAPGRPLAVQFKNSDNFRFWGAGNLSSVAVDQATGKIWYTDQSSGGVIGEFDPSNNVTRRWVVGGRPRDVVVASSGLIYATVETTNQIVEIDPVTTGVRSWGIPGGGLDSSGASANDNPDGIAIDSAGRIWFAESVGDNITRLDLTNNEFAQYSKTGLNEPQNVASSGSGGTLQTFFSEGAGNAVGIVTEVEAAGIAALETLTVVAPTAPATVLSSATLTPSDDVHLPTSKTLPFVSTIVDGEDGVPGSGATLTGTGEFIPGIIRFPLPAGSTRATGMTEVALPNTVFGSLIGSEQFYQLSSGAIIATPDEPEPGVDPRTPGYWKNHPDHTESLLPITVGDEVVNTLELALEILNNGSAKDATNALAKHLLATKLNVANNSENKDCIASVVDDADDYLKDNPRGSGVKGKDKGPALALKDQLDAYNNGNGFCFPGSGALSGSGLRSVTLSSGYILSGSGFVPRMPFMSHGADHRELCSVPN